MDHGAVDVEMKIGRQKLRQSFLIYNILNPILL